MDATSPAHEGSQTWEGTSLKKPETIIKAIGHFAKELNFLWKDEDKVKQAAENIRIYYDQSVKEKQENVQ